MMLHFPASSLWSFDPLKASGGLHSLPGNSESGGVRTLHNLVRKVMKHSKPGPWEDV